MARTQGATNKSWREVDAMGRFLIDKAKLMRKNEELKAALKKATSK